MKSKNPGNFNSLYSNMVNYTYHWYYWLIEWNSLDVFKTYNFLFDDFKFKFNEIKKKKWMKFVDKSPLKLIGQKTFNNLSKCSKDGAILLEVATNVNDISFFH